MVWMECTGVPGALVCSERSASADMVVERKQRRCALLVMYTERHLDGFQHRTAPYLSADNSPRIGSLGYSHRIAQQIELAVS